MNVVKILVDKYKMRFEEIAAEVGCSFQSTRDWYREKKHPMAIYRRKLLELLKTKQKGKF